MRRILIILLLLVMFINLYSTNEDRENLDSLKTMGLLDNSIYEVPEECNSFYRDNCYNNYTVFGDPEHLPEFPGGMKGLATFIRENLQYPSECKEKMIQGRVVVRFIIDESGKIICPYISHPLHPALDAEAFRITKLLPDWKPASNGDVPCKICFTLPINFDPNLLPLSSRDLIESEFKLQNTFPIGTISNANISTMDHFYLKFNADSSYYSLQYSYENEINQTIETIEYPSILYGSMLYSFESRKNNSYVVLWKNKNEYFPVFYAYYIQDGKLMKIGEWAVYTLCKTCDTQDYSIEDIRISQQDDEVVFLFLKDVEFMDYKEGDKGSLKSFKAGALTLSFNIEKLVNKRLVK